MSRKKIGEFLVEKGRVSTAELESALREQHGKTVRLGELLLSRGAISRQGLIESLTEVLQIEYLDVASVEVDPVALKLIPRAIAVQHSALPVRQDGGKLVIVMADPQNLRSLDQLRFSSGKDLSPRFGFRPEIVDAIDRCYQGPSSRTHARAGLPAQAAASGSSQIHAEAEVKVVRSSAELSHRLIPVEDIGLEFETSKTTEASRAASKELQSAKHNEKTPAVRMVSTIIATAIREGASDIHIDPHASGAVVRIRVDGMLRDILEVPTQQQAALTSRIKILAEMDISERRAPQDGRVFVNSGKGRIDLRVSTLPTQFGEKIVLRLLDPKAARVQFEDLGLSEATANSLRRVIAQPQGMLLVTGPTGSGKTTTLYAVLNQIRSRSKNIITVEDPVEYMMEGVNQVQVNVKAGRSFANCLRSILRQDPNIIMVGEIRDSETAEIALSSSQTGHMVLSTLHTNDSVAAIGRLVDLGMAPFVVASSVSAVIAQRLLRKLCSCSKQVPLSGSILGFLLNAGVQDFGETMAVPVGCPACVNSGYKGRVGIYEILFVNEQTRAYIRNNASPDEISKAARGEGMRLMQEEALDKARAGVTSLEEIFRVIPFGNVPVSARCEACGRDVMPTFLYCPQCGADRLGRPNESKSRNILEPAGVKG
jgi:type IV pilus assembly protein PilB